MIDVRVEEKFQKKIQSTSSSDSHENDLFIYFSHQFIDHQCMFFFVFVLLDQTHTHTQPIIELNYFSYNSICFYSCCLLQSSLLLLLLLSIIFSSRIILQIITCHNDDDDVR